MRWMIVFVRILLVGGTLALCIEGYAEQWPALEIAITLGVGTFLTGLTFLTGNPDTHPW